MKLPIDGAEHAIISDEVLNLPSRPKKLAVIGGGYIGLEFAGIYSNYGSEVHVVYRQVRPLASCIDAVQTTFHRGPQEGPGTGSAGGGGGRAGAGSWAQESKVAVITAATSWCLHSARKRCLLPRMS